MFKVNIFIQLNIFILLSLATLPKCFKFISVFTLLISFKFIHTYIHTSLTGSVPLLASTLLLSTRYTHEVIMYDKYCLPRVPSLMIKLYIILIF